MSLKNKNFFEHRVRFHVFPKAPEILGTHIHKNFSFPKFQNVNLRCHGM